MLVIINRRERRENARSLRGLLGGYLFLRRASGNGKRERKARRQRLLDEKDTDLRKFLIAITEEDKVS